MEAVKSLEQYSQQAIWIQPRTIQWQENSKRWEYVGTSDSEIIMDYYYELPDLSVSAEEAQKALLKKDLPLTVVSLDDQPVLALTSGGMDLSPEICQAYILLGYLPPIHFTLPRGQEYDQSIVRACIESGHVAKQSGEQHMEYHKDLLSK